MLWVSIFIIGLLGLLAGAMPLILNGANLRGLILAVVGALLLVAGGAGTIARPTVEQLITRVASFGQSTQPIPSEPTVAAADPPTAPVDNGPKVRIIQTEPVTTPSSSKDESQLEPSKLPLPVQTTTITGAGSESDPLAAPAMDPAPAAATPSKIQSKAQSKTTDQAPDQAPDAPPAPAVLPAAPPATNEADILASLTDQQSKQENAFIQAMTKGKQTYTRADDSGRAAAQSTRAAAVCAALGKPDVKGWVGAVKAIEKDSGGRLIVTLTLSDGTLVKTWNNAMSDADDKTLVESGTPLAANLESMKPADAVRFSGSFFLDDTDCVRSSRLGLDQSMMEPSYLFRFNAVEKL